LLLYSISFLSLFNTRVHIYLLLILGVVKRNPLFFHSISCKNNGFLFTTPNIKPWPVKWSFLNFMLVSCTTIIYFFHFLFIIKILFIIGHNKLTCSCKKYYFYLKTNSVKIGRNKLSILLVLVFCVCVCVCVCAINFEQLKHIY